MELFETINKEQKGVDISHLTNLIATYQGEENIPEATAIILSDSKNSPLRGLIRKEIGIQGKNFFTGKIPIRLKEPTRTLCKECTGER